MVSIQIPTVSPSNFYFRTWVHRTFVRETFCRTILTFVCRAFIFRTYLEISVSDQSNKQSNEDWESTNNLKNKTWILNTVLTYWFARKNLRRHSCIYNVYYYWHDSGSFNFWRDISLSILKCIFVITETELFFVANYC